MDIKALHKRFKDNDSPSPEGQIRWLQKQGFAQHQIDQAMLWLYGDIEAGRLPRVFEKKNGDKLIDTRYAPNGTRPPHFEYEIRDIKNGWDLDQALLEFAKIIRTREFENTIKTIEEFEKKMRKKWMAQGAWYRRMFGLLPKEDSTE